MNEPLVNSHIMQPLVYLKIILGSEQKHQSHRTFIHGHIPQGASISLTLGDRWLFTFIVSHIKNKKTSIWALRLLRFWKKQKASPVADRHVQWVCVLAAVCLFGSQFSEFTEGRRAVLGITQKSSNVHVLRLHPNGCTNRAWSKQAETHLTPPHPLR